MIDHYIDIITKLPEKPIVIGHSLGGLITQIITNRGYSAAGVAIHSVPPKGVIPTQFSFYKATWRSLGLFTSLKKSFLMTLKEWQYGFTNGMAEESQKSSYEELAAPESKLLLRDGLTSAAKVNFDKVPAPLLLTSGSIDNCVPAALNLKNYKKYKKGNSRDMVEYKEFSGRNHFVLGQSAWKEDADYILEWINGKE